MKKSYIIFVKVLQQNISAIFQSSFSFVIEIEQQGFLRLSNVLVTKFVSWQHVLVRQQH